MVCSNRECTTGLLYVLTAGLLYILIYYRIINREFTTGLLYVLIGNLLQDYCMF